MGWKAFLSQPMARLSLRRLQRRVSDPVAAQGEVLEGLLKKGQATAFGRAHGLRPGRKRRRPKQIVKPM